MIRYEVIPSKVWQRDDGARASIYGALPWPYGASQAEIDRWKVVDQGWTVRNPHTGEVGACRKPWATQAEAAAFAASARPSRICIGD